MVDLTQNIQFIKGVGPNRVKLLNKLGIYTLGDLISYYPRDYEDRSKPINIVDAEDGTEVLIQGRACGYVSEIRTRKKNMTIYKLNIEDETGNCQITWYNQKYIKQLFEPGKIYKFYGKITKKGSKANMVAPVFDQVGKDKNTGKIIPIYPLTYSLTQNIIRQIIENGVQSVDGKLEETLPSYLLESNNLLGINESVRKIHFPNEFKDFNEARNRLVFEELLSMQLLLLTLKNSTTEKVNGIKFDKDVKMSDIINDLPFKLTRAQIRVLEEIDKDMESDKIMNRLLQGDVGSGKTIVSIIAAYKAVKSGYQMTIMAPTSILASQHMESFNSMLSRYGIRCELLIGSTTKKQREILLEDLKNGDIDILIGTHAILEENVVFKNLGLVVTDEQHRFGVRQRSIISQKGNNPDVLVMTATPIPRTLALILYGDLDISIIDELPPNRKKIDTFAVTKDYEERVNVFVKKQVDEGRQAYIVCPLVEDSDESDLKSVMELAEKYKDDVFADYRVTYLHGKMRSKEKDAIMEEFKKGNIDILISTTVIEVGVNVHNASIMVIEDAERFGLAALHQLRGRVGRGGYQSYCILKYEGKSDIVRKRMKVMHDTNDGFIISEKDLELRGSGDFFGTKQHGLPDFKIANLFQDMPMLKKVQQIAVNVLREDPKLELEKNKKLKKIVDEKFKGKIEL